jgi:deoxyribose-phosphate aldolase
LETAKKMIANGADLLGTSSGVKILQGLSVDGTY